MTDETVKPRRSVDWEDEGWHTSTEYLEYAQRISEIILNAHRPMAISDIHKRMLEPKREWTMYAIESLEGLNLIRSEGYRHYVKEERETRKLEGYKSTFLFHKENR